jgi:hypothetical protein
VKEKELTPEQKKEKYQEAILEGLPDEVKEMLKVHEIWYIVLLVDGYMLIHVRSSAN